MRYEWILMIAVLMGACQRAPKQDPFAARSSLYPAPAPVAPLDGASLGTTNVVPQPCQPPGSAGPVRGLPQT